MRINLVDTFLFNIEPVWYTGLDVYNPGNPGMFPPGVHCELPEFPEAVEAVALAFLFPPEYELYLLS